MSENENSDNLVEYLVDINRVTKVVKGGRNFSFSSIVVVGDTKGKVGYGNGKAKEISQARTKARKEAKKNIVKIALYNNRTIPHDVIGKSGAASVLLRSAVPGTGIIAGGAMRAVFASLGIEDIVAKSLGSCNKNTMISATFDALSKLNSAKAVKIRKANQLLS
ncbi:30S ribosomal protein S5 [Rickettsia endosymbiont of Cardiosporidium cionae]|uniref:30S ribosomal protein S5 n=1 Tax=Rickettsia endosymbiont of Cardiosporidium cionae TaxID=2777155 RepID=UPI001893DD86|nr:30S ribosomal protein S5 [Rickettsia endosymbiont of Cardiosporidium cionae]KAF8818185.1 30S ribosomal protein S5 [Rickettsia endosymbiont of Cardiosporidium cionae]